MGGVGKINNSKFNKNMNGTIRTGGSIFPTYKPDRDRKHELTGGMRLDESGMTLRDYIATESLKVLVSATENRDFYTPASFADKAYRLADAMLVERAKTEVAK